jgi:eukaryotic-like serine/threonine-protein kinase
MNDLVGRVLSGRYRLIAPIGAGASAQVLLADDTRLRRRVAVKLLHAALAHDEGFLRRFRAEAQAAAALNHPNIVAVYDWGEDDGTPYLITEYLAGGSLRGVLDLGRRLTPSQALLVGLEATRALDQAHRRGFVHRDMKPANLLFGEEGRLRIADFGLARALAEAAWTEPAGAVVGTARYAAPEQVRGEPVDGRADVYSLALVLIEAVTGRVPFAADTTIATLMARVDKPVDVPPELGPLRRALARAGQPDPEERPDAGELAVALMAAAEELPRPAPLPLAGAIASGALPDDDQDPTMLPGTAAVPTTTALPPADSTIVDLPSVVGPVDEPAVDTPRRRRRWPKVAAVVVVVAALAAGGLFLWQTVLVPSHEVPELVALDVEAARALVDENGWDVEIREDREDGSEPGDVLRQDPPPGESLKEGRTVVLTVSLGQELRRVPTDLGGLPFEEAVIRLDQAGLTAADPVQRHHEEIPAGSVIRTVDATPEEAETGTAITLVVSQGPAPRTVPPTEGQTLEQVCQALAGLQLQCEEGEAFSDTVPEGFVVGTEPPAGAAAERDSVVRVLVSQGPRLIPVPDVAGRDIATAAQVLEDAGFTVSGVRGSPFRTVTGTDPPAGTRAERGSGVVLVTR